MSSPAILLLCATVAQASGDPPVDAVAGETTVEALEVVESSEAPKMAESRRDWLAFTLTMSYELKNLSLGASFRYFDYFETHIASDFLVTALMLGFGLDDLNAIRFSLAQTAGARITINPLGVESRFGPRPEPGPYPNVILGGGLWTLIEVDSLTQLVRLGDAGIFVGASAGFFATFAFSAISLTTAYRPLSITAYYLDAEWDRTELVFGNPVLELSLTYTLPW